MDKNVIGFTPYEAIVAEMSADGLSELVRIDPELAKGVVDPTDSDPVFVTIEVLNEGVSRNGRKWTKELIASVCEQINSKHPDGYRGHIPEAERSHKAPDAETIWLGAAVREVNGKTRLFAKGYVLPYATKLRQYLRSAKAAGKNVAVSVYGTARAVKDAASGVLNMQNFNLESIDWARPGSEGVLNLGIFAVTAEMHDDSKPTKQEDTMDKVEVIKSVTVSEMEQHNPALIEEITKPLADANAEAEAVVSEMTEIKTLIGASDDKPVKEIVSEMQSQLNGYKVEDEIAKHVDSAKARRAIKPLVVAEMTANKSVEDVVTDVLKGEEAQWIIKEMTEIAPRVQPKIKTPQRVAERKFTRTK